MVANLERQIAREYPGIAQSTAYYKIEEATGISFSSMQRIMSGGTGPSIDTLSDLARHLGSSVSEILELPKDGKLAVRHDESGREELHRSPDR